MSISSVEQDAGGQRGGSEVKAWLNNYQILLPTVHAHAHTDFISTLVLVFVESGQHLPLWVLVLKTQSNVLPVPRLSQWHSDIQPSFAQTHMHNACHTHNPHRRAISQETGGRKGVDSQREAGWIDLACQPWKAKGHNKGPLTYVCTRIHEGTHSYAHTCRQTYTMVLLRIRSNVGGRQLARFTARREQTAGESFWCLALNTSHREV